MPASSTTSTHVPVGSCPARPAMAATVVLLIPAPSSQLARSSTAPLRRPAPEGRPSSHASRAAPRANVLPGASLAGDHAPRRRPARTDDATIARCSSESDGRAAMRRLDRPAPAVGTAMPRPPHPIDKPLLERQKLGRRVPTLLGGDRQHADRRAAGTRPSSASTPSPTQRHHARRGRGTHPPPSRARAPSTVVPAGSRSQSSSSTSRRPKLDRRCVSPRGPASSAPQRRQRSRHRAARADARPSRARRRRRPRSQPQPRAAATSATSASTPTGAPFPRLVANAAASAARAPIGPALHERRLDLRPPPTEGPHAPRRARHRSRRSRRAPASTQHPAPGSAHLAAPPGRRSSPPAHARRSAEHPAPTTAHPARARGWRRAHAYGVAGRPPRRPMPERGRHEPAGLAEPTAPPRPRRTAAADRSR